MHALLFTDLEASTRLWEEHPEEMSQALARHDAILGEAVAGAGGNVLKTTGDGMIAVFDAVSDALAAALEGQRHLAAEPWGMTRPLRVRMGVHAGEAESREGDYFGPVMNRAARIMAAGHGGQVLVSAAAAQLAEGRLPRGATLRDLGTHRLKDLTLPERLYQLVHDDLSDGFPPPATLDARAHNLPVQTTEFLGRRNELAAIQVILEAPGTRLLTVTGPGGAGKTRIALQVAAEQLDNYRDGVFFVDLSAERDPDAAFEAVVRALALPASGSDDPLLVLKARLRDARMLLVLDNFEQVTSAAVGVADLLRHAPGLKVMVTSRETLRVRAEHVFPVPPLDLPNPGGGAASIAASEAVQLFVDRARAVRPDFSLTDDNARVVAEICLRLDGLPLAIELAAARLNVFTPSDLLSRLRDRLDVLGAGGRDLPDRQRTLWGAIGWSYELLDEEERIVFELLSVFSGADLAAIEEVAASAAGDAVVLDSLASLVDKSLVRSDESAGSTRFSMLLTIKEYAATRLGDDPEREAEVRASHARYYSDYAGLLEQGLRGSQRQATLDRLVTEIGNLRTAWRYWVDRGDLERLFRLMDALWALHEAKGWYHAAIELASDALALLATAEPSPELAAEELTLRTSLARGLMAVHGYTVEVERAFHQVLEMAEAGGGAAQRYPVLRALATYYSNISDFERARQIGLQLLQLGEAEGDDSITIEGHYVYGSSTAFGGDLREGLHHLERVIQLHHARLHGSDRFRFGPNTGVVARVASGLLLWSCGALERAIDRVGEALVLARALDHPYSVAYALYHNAFLALNRRRFQEAMELAQELGVVATENGYLVWRTLAKVVEGVSRTALGETEEGLAMAETAIELYQGLTTPPVFWPLILALRALVHAMAGDPERARALVEEAISLSPSDESVQPELWVHRGDFLLALPDPDPTGAEESYLKAARFAGESGFHLVELQARTRLVQLRRNLGRLPDGRDHLAAVYDQLGEGFEEPDMVAAASVLGR